MSGDLLSWLQAEEVAMDEHPILVGYDGATNSAAALRWAAAEALRRGLGIRLIRVLDLPGQGDEEFGGRVGLAEAQMLGDAKLALDQAAAQVPGGRPPGAVTSLARGGPVVSALCEHSAQASMLVLGSRGMGGLGGLLLGSVSVPVAAHAHCPVVVVREQMSAPAAGPVAVGIDDSDEARLAVEFAFAAAAARRVGLLAVHAVAVPGRGGGPVPAEPAAHPGGPDPVAAALRGGQARYPAVPVTTRVRAGSPGQVLAAASAEAQLLVVGSRGRGGFHGLLLGSVSQQVLHRAHAPVAVVRRYPAAGTGAPVTGAVAARETRR
jgi:nucleotide-binding universal stress UspA family protein